VATSDTSDGSSWIDIRVSFDVDDVMQAHITLSRHDTSGELDDGEYFLLIDAEEDIELIPDQYYEGFAIEGNEISIPIAFTIPGTKSIYLYEIDS